MRWKTADIIRAEKPDLIITHHDVSMHKDHECCHRIVKDAWFYAALPSFKRELPAHFAHLYFAENWEDAVEYHPYIYREISEEAFKLSSAPGGKSGVDLLVYVPGDRNGSYG